MIEERWTMRMVGFFAMAAFALAVPAGMAAAQPAADAAPAPAYMLGTSDKLHITVYGEDRFTGDYAIRGDGKISFPMVGDVQAAGLSVADFLTAITARLADGYLLNPRVTAELISFRPVFILGEVAKPGEYPFADGMTVYTLAAQAGGFTYRASRKSAKIRHAQDADEAKVRIESSTPVLPGDTIRIGQRYFCWRGPLDAPEPAAVPLWRRLSPRAGNVAAQYRNDGQVAEKQGQQPRRFIAHYPKIYASGTRRLRESSYRKAIEII